MSNVNDIFRSTSQSLWETMESHGGKVGFMIPEYQRPYDWDRSNLKRLLEDCLNGFYYLSQDSNQESYTFLGTIILVDENRAEPSFDGSSLEIVDGQQRLTTLTLLSCALLQQIRLSIKDIEVLNNDTKIWLRQEIESLTEALFQCTSGYLTQRGSHTPFPRVVRERTDNRANTYRGSEYRSNIASFLWDFSQYYLDYNTNSDPQFDHKLGADDEIGTNYDYLKRQIRTYVHEAVETDEKRPNTDIDCEVVGRSAFEKQSMRRLFHKLNVFPDQGAQNRALATIANTGQTEGIIRLVLFSWYFLKRVVITRVETDDEKYAFDIFDALNTTGQPLTALETLKPLVVQWENQSAHYFGSRSEFQFERLDRDVNERFPGTEERQRETKNLLVSFALYHAGKKLGLDLGSQRAFLRAGFQAARNSQDDAHRYMSGIADVSEFRKYYWAKEGIAGLDARHPHDPARNDVLKLCLAFISDTNTSLAIPALTRYWIQYKDHGDELAFVAATKSLAAFLALRRAVTGGTGGIDADFRSLMEDLCVSSGNPPLPHGDLNKKLKDYLQKRRIGIQSRDSWVNQSRETPLGSSTNHLCRFLLFAAANNAKPDTGNPGMWTRDKVIRSEQLNFFNYRVWGQPDYSTVEHVAPDANPGGGWDSGIYERPTTRHTIGNLVLLPQRENSSVGNAPWEKKKLFYAALRAETKDERQALVEQAKLEGFRFTQTTEKLLDQQRRLHMLDSLANVEEWTQEFVRKRSENILRLAWDVIAPWVYE